MLSKQQIKELPVGIFPNHKLFGPNSYRFIKEKDPISGENKNKVVPTYDNRRQIRRAKYAKVKKGAGRQEIFLTKVASDDIISGIINGAFDCFDHYGKLKSKYKKIIYHTN